MFAYTWSISKPSNNRGSPYRKRKRNAFTLKSPFYRLRTLLVCGYVYSKPAEFTNVYQYIYIYVWLRGKQVDWYWGSGKWKRVNHITLCFVQGVLNAALSAWGAFPMPRWLLPSCCMLGSPSSAAAVMKPCRELSTFFRPTLRWQELLGTLLMYLPCKPLFNL